MQLKIINRGTSDKEKQSCFNKTRHFLYDLNCDYPFFEEWLEKAFASIYTGERTIIICESDNGFEVLGACIIKNTKEEKKICTLRVTSSMFRKGIGTHLITKAIELLGEKYPLITVPQKHKDAFANFFKLFKFKLIKRVKSIYNAGSYEYYYNKPFVCENVLMSVRPQYSELISLGKKTVEFRKKCFGEMVKHVYVYSTSPVKKIIGYFSIESIDEDEPNNLWSKYRTKGGISLYEFNDYFSNIDKGYAILIKSFIPFRCNLSIHDVFGDNYSVPQNYRYIDNMRALHIMKLLTADNNI